MKLNAGKTNLLCVSSAVSFRPKTYINAGTEVIISGTGCRLLGFHFDSTPGVGAHVRQILKKVRYRVWASHNLKRLGLCPSGLINVYLSLVRPCFDYACVVYHSLLTKTQSEMLEAMQQKIMKIMKIIYGFDLSYCLCLERANIDSLSVRRAKLCEK